MAKGFPISVSAAMTSQLLFGPFFAGPSWNLWRTVIKAAFAEKMSAEEFQLFDSVADRFPPTSRVRELVVCAGRGAGKDSVASLLAVMAAINFNPKGQLRPGERATVMCLACDRSQARIVHGYIAAYFRAIPALAALVLTSNRHSISLSTPSTSKFSPMTTRQFAEDLFSWLFATK